MNILYSIITLIIVTIIVIEIELRPRLDETHNGDIILWYGKRKRHHKILGKRK